MKSEFINCTSSSYKSCSEAKHQNGADGWLHSFLDKVSVSLEILKIKDNRRMINQHKQNENDHVIAIPGFHF